MNTDDPTTPAYGHPSSLEEGSYNYLVPATLPATNTLRVAPRLLENG